MNMVRRKKAARPSTHHGPPPPKLRCRTPSMPMAGPVLGGLLLAIANPKAFAAIGAAYASVVIVPDRLGLDASAKLAALFGVILIVNSSLLVLGAFLARLLRHPRCGRAINLLFALLLVLSVVMAASI